MSLNFHDLQLQVSRWSLHNFDDQPSYRPLLGAVEELGELCHAHLKSEQGIRGDKESHQEAAKDAIGDVIIYLADYAAREGYNLQEIIEETWTQVSKRDWKANPRKGESLNPNVPNPLYKPEPLNPDEPDPSLRYPRG